MADGLPGFLGDTEFGHTNLAGAASPEDLFSILDTFEDATKEILPFSPLEEAVLSPKPGDEPAGRPNTRPYEAEEEEDDDGGASRSRKKPKVASVEAPAEAAAQDGQSKMSHITVERNRRKQMNEHLSALRSLMPCFYVKRGDQASIIGGVVDYIKELQQVLQSLEAKKQRKVIYSEVLSPRPVSSPRPPPLSPCRLSPLSPRLGLPISPRTPQPGSPYKPRIPPSYLSPTKAAGPSLESSPISLDTLTELAANSKSPVADVEVKFSGPNVLLKTVSSRIPGQALKIIAALEGLSLEILHVSINTVDDTMLNSFTIKIGIECQLSAEELAQEIQQTFL